MGVFLNLRGDLHAGPVRGDLIFIDSHVQLDDLGDSQVVGLPGEGFNGISGGLFPGGPARSHQFNDFVDASCHASLSLTATLEQVPYGRAFSGIFSKIFAAVSIGELSGSSQASMGSTPVSYKKISKKLKYRVAME